VENMWHINTIIDIKIPNKIVEISAMFSYLIKNATTTIIIPTEAESSAIH